MVLVTNKDLLIPARQRAYAVGAFNVNNLETLLAVEGVLWQNLDGEGFE
jgi:fructose/tagatose bisphosphate aldolase